MKNLVVLVLLTLWVFAAKAGDGLMADCRVDKLHEGAAKLAEMGLEEGQRITVYEAMFGSQLHFKIGSIPSLYDGMSFGAYKVQEMDIADNNLMGFEARIDTDKGSYVYALLVSLQSGSGELNSYTISPAGEIQEAKLANLSCEI